MAHQHPVKDTDLHFVIDPVTRVVENNSGKIVIMQHDHQSEIFTFELPRYIDTHDMSLSNTVRVHYINIGTSSKYTPVSGVYEVNDLQVDATNENLVTFSWTLTNNTTQLEGTLNFIIRFSCLTGDTIDYSWSTAIYSGIIVAKTIDSSDYVMTAIPDILEQWKASLKGDPFTYEDFTPEQLEGLRGPAGIIISETEPTNEDHPVWVRPSGEYIVENLGLTGATVGQVPVVKAVDENGVPTEWEAGDSKPFVVTVTYGDDGTLTADKTHAEIVAAYAAGAQINAKIVNYPGVNAPCILPLYVNNPDLVFIFSGSGALDGRAMAMTAQDFNGSWSVSLTKLATPDDIPSGGTDTSLGLTGATVGQTVKIKAVDANGVPTEWEAADAASGGDRWTEIGELTMEGTKFIISDYTDGVITVTPDNGIYPSVGRNYVIRKPDYSAYTNAHLVATATEGKFTLLNLDNAVYTPSEDLTQYVIDAPNAPGELVFSNLPSFSFFKIGITIPLLSSHGLRSTIAVSGKIPFTIGAACSYLVGGAVEAIIETDESPVSGKDYVKASFKGKKTDRSNGYDVIDFVNKSTSDIIKIAHYNGLMVSGTNVKLWGRN